MVNLDELERLADAATAGPWRETGVFNRGWSGIYPGVEMGPPPVFLTNSIADEDRAYIAAADPSTVKALTARIRELEEVAKAAAAFRFADERSARGKRLTAALAALDAQS